MEDKKLIRTEELSGLDDLLTDPNRLLPRKFEPKAKRHFVISIPGVDSFLVHCINELPELKKNWFNKKTLRCVGDLKITFHSAVSPSTIQQLTQLVKLNKKFNIVLKQYDSIGKVIAQQTFLKCSLDSFRVLNYSYDSSDIEKALGSFKCKSVAIDF